MSEQPSVLRRRWVWLLIAALLLAALGASATLYYQRGPWPQWALRRAHQVGSPRNARWYALLRQRYPALDPYTRLWAAEEALPDLAAVQVLFDLIDHLPDGPVALEAHVALARYYASIESPQTLTEYQAALDIDDRPDLRLELAWYLEAQASPAGAYAHYLALLGPDREDAFVGARRTAPDRITLARDLLERDYLNDVVDVLYGLGDCEAYCVRADALGRLGRDAEASATAVMCETCSAPAPADGEAAAPSAAETDEADEPVAAQTPLELWLESWDLEDAADHAPLLPLYLRLARTDSVYTDDAAYRAIVLAQRLGEPAVETEARSLLAATQPSWLAYLATGELPLCIMPDYPAEAVGALTAPVIARVLALEELGLAELAHQELRLAALNSETPEVLQRMAQGLLARGYTVQAWSLARAYLRREPCAPRALWELAYPRPYAEQVALHAATYDVKPSLIWAVMMEESAYQPEIVSWAGARGLMQIMPFTHEQYCDEGLVPCAPGVAFEAGPSITMGAAHVREYADYYDGDLELALLAYNAGPGNVDQWLADPNVHDRDDMRRLAWFGETREYLQRVMLDALVYQALYGE